MGGEPVIEAWKASMRRPYPNSVAQKALTGALLSLVVVIGLSVAGLDRREWAMSFAVSVLAILAFVVFFQSDGERESRTEALRRAITASSVITFLVLVGVTMFVADPDDASTELARDLVGDFRWVVITVVGFYFANETVGSFLEARYGPRDDETED
jgi:hypothetical protein